MLPFEKTCAERLWWLTFRALRRGDASRIAAGQLPDGCFGALGERERLALEGMIDGQRGSAPAAGPQVPDTDSVEYVSL